MYVVAQASVEHQATDALLQLLTSREGTTGANDVLPVLVIVPADEAKVTEQYREKLYIINAELN